MCPQDTDIKEHRSRSAIEYSPEPPATSSQPDSFPSVDMLALGLLLLAASIASGQFFSQQNLFADDPPVFGAPGVNASYDYVVVG